MSNEIPFFDYRPELALFREEIDESFKRVLDSGRTILGEEVASFESELGNFVGSNHVIGMSSGTAALELALLACGIGSGEEVLLPANVCPPTACAVLAAGGTPVFCDVRPEDGLLDMGKLSEKISEKVKAVIPVHLYGNPMDLEFLRELAVKHHFRIIEDCAQAFGSFRREKHVGTIGDIGCFSFYPTKNLGAFGDAGACVTKDELLASKLKLLRTYGYPASRVSELPGRNARIDELQAAFLRVKLKHVTHSLQERRKVAESYLSTLKRDLCHFSSVKGHGTHSFHLFVIRCSERERLLEKLTRSKIGFGIHYPVPLHVMPAFKQYVRPGDSLKNCELLSEEVVSLPLYPGITDEHVERVVHCVNSI